MPMTLAELTPAHADYARLLAGLPQALLYHGREWLEMLEAVTGCEVRVLGAYSGSRLAGVLPVALSPDLGQGRVINSLPFFGSIGGVLAQDEDWEGAAGVLLHGMDTLAAKSRARCAMLNPGPLDAHGASCQALWQPDLEDQRMSQMAPLPVAPAEIFSLFHDSKRRNVASALRKGVAVTPARDADWGWFASMHERAIAGKGGLVKPAAFLDWARTASGVGGPVHLWIAEHEGAPCAGLLFSVVGRVAEYLVPVHDLDQASLFGLPLLVHRGMEHARSAGCAWWNFGGTWATQEGVYRFKRQLGGEDFPYRYYIKLYDPDLLALSREELQRAFPWFYCVPYSALTRGGEGACS